MLYSILKGCLACLIILSVAACEKDVTKEGQLLGTWHFTEMQGPEGRLLEADVPPLSLEGDTLTRSTTVNLFLDEEDCVVTGDVIGEIGTYRITNRGAWEAMLHHSGHQVLELLTDPWLEKLQEALRAAHSYELEGNQLIIYNDEMRVFLQKQ